MIHLVVTVENTAELLATEAYGAGALLRWESCATVDGTYVEGGTIALVAGTASYDVWDAAGVTGTWYRTRVSNAGGTTFSAYSLPREGGITSVTSVAQVRALVPTSMSDADLQDLIDREEAALARQIGPLSGPRTQVWYVGDPSGPWPVYGFGPLYGSSLAHMGAQVASDRMGPLALLRPADAVEITDNGVVVAPEDVRLLRNGTQIERASGGWAGPIVVGTYTPNDLSEVIRVVIGLCRLTAGDTGYQSETIDGYSYTRETKAQTGVDPRKALIRSLQTHPPRGTVGVRTSNDTARVGPVVAP